MESLASLQEQVERLREAQAALIQRLESLPVMEHALQEALGRLKAPVEQRKAEARALNGLDDAETEFLGVPMRVRRPLSS